MESDLSPAPVPPDDLVSRVTGSPDPTLFVASGEESVRELERTLSLAGRNFSSFDSILDFGCGCGRMLLRMKDRIGSANLHGTDIDSEAIAWCTENIPYARLSVNDADPPLPFPDDSFDLIYNHSVFTHIDEPRQDAWLSELRRVIRPGGILVLSTHGEVALGADPWGIRTRLETEGIVFLDSVHPEDFPLPDWYQVTYHAPWYVFEHWGKWFKIRALAPGAALGVQDHVLLELPEDESALPVPLSARPQQSQPEPPLRRRRFFQWQSRTG